MRGYSALFDTRVLAERIHAREPPSWSGLAGLVAHARSLAQTMPALRGVDLVIATGDRCAESVAAAIRAALP